MEETTEQAQVAESPKAFDRRIKWEQAQAMKVANLVAMLGSIKEFKGEIHTLDYFIQRMDQAQALLDGAQLARADIASLQGCMIAKIDMSLLIELGLSFTSSWADAKVRLRQKFRNATQSVGRVAWKMTRLRIQAGEPLSSYSRRVSDALRLTRERLAEVGGEEPVIAIKAVVYEELAMETLWAELPESLRSAVRAGKPTSLEGMIAIVRDEETEREEGRVARPTVIERKSFSDAVKSSGNRGFARQIARQAQRSPPREPVTSSRRQQPVYGRSGGRPRDAERRQWRRLECWECGSETHLARSCPHRYRRNNNSARMPAYQEPMEVNVGHQKRAKNYGRRRSSTDRSSSDEASGYSSYDESPRPIEPGRESDASASGKDWHVVPSKGRPWKRQASAKGMKQD